MLMPPLFLWKGIIPALDVMTDAIFHLLILYVVVTFIQWWWLNLITFHPCFLIAWNVLSSYAPEDSHITVKLISLPSAMMSWIAKLRDWCEVLNMRGQYCAGVVTFNLWAVLIVTNISVSKLFISYGTVDLIVMSSDLLATQSQLILHMRTSWGRQGMWEWLIMQACSGSSFPPVRCGSLHVHWFGRKQE